MSVLTERRLNVIKDALEATEGQLLFDLQYNLNHGDPQHNNDAVMSTLHKVRHAYDVCKILDTVKQEG